MLNRGKVKKALVTIDMQVMPFIWKNYGGKAFTTRR
jgi:hypothetical protein